MTAPLTNTPHWSFWLIAILMLLWNALGCINFVVQLNPDMIAAYRQTEQAVIHLRPWWATAGFAIAVFAGALGCLFLLFKKSKALGLFIASFVGVIITMLNTFTANVHFTLGEWIGIIVLPMVLAALLITYTHYAINKGWLTAPSKHP